MDLRRAGAWDWLTGLAGVVLIVDLWLPWYGAAGLTANAWEAFTYVDLLLALAGLSAIALVVVTAAAPAAAIPRIMNTCVLWLGVAASVFAVIRLINVPGVDTILAGGAA